MHPTHKMSAIELRASTSLALIFFLRMLGLFLILPVFVLYADELSDATPTLIGVAFGVYGLTQALFQIPFGMILDRIGRKPVITMGLIIFALGSVIAGMAESIWVVILGRMLQGTGAIAATVMALAADLTSESQRTKAMVLSRLRCTSYPIFMSPVMYVKANATTGKRWISAIKARTFMKH